MAEGLIHKYKGKSVKAIKKMEEKPKPKPKKEPPVHKSGYKNTGPSNETLTRAQAEKIRAREQAKKKKAQEAKKKMASAKKKKK